MTLTATAWQARAYADRQTAERLADTAFEEGLADTASAHETPQGWCAELTFEHEPDLTLLPDACWTLEPLKEADWVARSLEGLHPVRAGRFVVHGGHDRHRLPAGAIGIEVEAGLAFGTGHHGTTWGCLVALDRTLRRGTPERALDLGCGTGVLAIALAKALPGGVPVLASDIDADSVRIARENAEANRVGARVAAFTAAGLDHPALRGNAPYDLVMANILAAPLKALSGSIAGAMAPGGTLILSGLLGSQENAVTNTYRAHGFVKNARVPSGEWRTLVMRRV